MHLLVIPWDVNPEIFRIGSFAVRWYGLLFASSFLFGYYIMNRIFKNENLGEATLDRLTIYMAVGVIIGARLGHCLFYEPAYYFSHPLEIIMIWHGGLASHGAAIGILIAVYLFTRKEKKDYLWALDRIAIVVALSGFLIRMGNLMNSEIYGVETTVPWGFVFLRNHEVAPKHPTQIYEGLAYLAIFVLLSRLYWVKKGKHIPGNADQPSMYTCFHSPILYRIPEGTPGSIRNHNETQYGTMAEYSFYFAWNCRTNLEH